MSMDPLSDSPKQTSVELRLGDLVDKDPLLLTDQEIDVITAHLRKAYVAWQTEEASAAINEKRPRTANGASEAKAKAKTVSLDDLGL